MQYEARIGLVYAHTKGRSSHNKAGLFGKPARLHRGPKRRRHARMIGLCGKSPLTQALR
ncbi:MAG: hypothetical protein NZ958_06145 [Bacteroidia bacterium]|nr:hypothetical protein [Bacteroidia bacterium]MDW8088801.1 hypothetical protein [Bacteroidia bacterium]